MIKDMPSWERPQEKLLYQGPGALSNAELMALVIRTGSRDKSALQLAEEVLRYSADLMQGDLEAGELMRIEGIGASKASALLACFELSRRLQPRERKARLIVRSAEDIAAMLYPRMAGEKREHVILFLLNVKGEIESEHLVSIGELSASCIHPREVFSPAVRRSAAAVILAHNHPSGDPTPSREDIEATQRLMDAADILGIRLLDHVVIGSACYVSLRAEGFLDQIGEDGGGHSRRSR